MANWGLRTKLLLLCGFISSLSILIGFTNYFAMRGVVADYERIVQEISPKVQALNEMRVRFGETRIALRSLGLEGLGAEAAAKYGAEVEASLAAFEKAKADYAAKGFAADDGDVFRRLEAAWTEFKDLGARTLALGHQGTAEARAEMMRIFTVDCVEAAARFQVTLDELTKLNGALAASSAGAATAKARTSNLLSALLNVFGFLISMALATWFAARIARSLSRVAATLSQGAGVLTGAVSQLSFASRELSDSAQRQSSALQETAASVEEISAMVGKNSENAQDSAKLSEESRGQAERGKKTVEQMIVSMSDINRSNRTIEEEIEANNRKFAEIVTVIKSIGDKTKVINDIVFQTQILSFNASVEAARAGEHGKGFSVVAREVGSLADMSGKAAAEITGLLDASVETVGEIIRQSTAKVEKLMSEARATVDRGGEVARECGELLEQIVANAGRLSGMVGDISMASREQAHGIAEISKAVQALDHSMQMNANSTRQTVASSETLSKEVQAMKQAANEVRRTVEGADAMAPVAKFVWREQYALGIAAMDDEHKVLIEKINLLATAIEERAKGPRLRALFDDLAAYCRQHFDDEERFMDRIQYPDLVRHKAIHKKLLERVGRFDADLRADRLDAEELVDFLNDWLIQHILGVDMKYSAFHHGGHGHSSARAA